MGWARTVSGTAVMAAVAAFTLGSCGSEATDVAGPAASGSASETSSSSEAPTTEPTDSASTEVPADAPVCGDVWVDGGRLARTYQGCVSDGAYVERDALGCSSGQRLVRYGDRFYGVVGGTIHRAQSPLQQDRKYIAAERRCTA